jgi:GRIP domain
MNSRMFLTLIPLSLLESFRLYRKKAKEHFEAQQNDSTDPSTFMTTGHGNNTSADAKLAYLKNLMKNYLSSDQSVRGHMEGAIMTVLQFSDHEINETIKKRSYGDAWF